MTTAQLAAVPQMPPTTFRERAMKALETHQGADLVSFLAMLHDQDVAELTEQAVSARTAGTSFTVTSSSGTDTSQFAYLLMEPQ